ncbi:UvrD-helicase domain-containing protein [Alicyclobacillus tolerans]|uniref:UvrD-helicase domain-containing protein n=1 Tax=Alicyclobacillus tolerans TaxID=90970 RepID=UPI001F008F7F|nr:UvrD-helicase domain-containing protein [Alicyclobacillus tolerans]MCF8565790.1 UvrD-helicase domain-containing protein [Alicyclobacillus tolerans]
MLDLSRWSDAQRRAISTRGQNVLVSAGAGSGKTSVLVERVMNCILGEDPVDLPRLLIVTFTEAAAGEMRMRIARRLQSIAAIENAQDPDLEHARMQKQALRQLALLEQAQISTLHSFCMNVVRDSFLYLGLDPGFDILSEEEAVVLRTDLFEQILEERLHVGGDLDERARFRQMLYRFGALDPKQLAPVVMRIHRFAQSQPNPQTWLKQMNGLYQQAIHQPLSEMPWTKSFVGWIVRQLQDAQELLTQSHRLSGDVEELQSYADSTREMMSRVKQAADAFSNRDFSFGESSLRAVLSGKSPRAKDHPQKKAVQAGRDAAKKRIKEVLEVVGRGEAALREDVIRLANEVDVLTNLVLEFEDRYWSAKLRRGKLDFNDLEHLALEALTDPNSGQADRIQARFAEIFVDEYQDTSPIQDALVNAAARPQGNVFTVGDVKQSIYRFRMAEPMLFVRKYEQYEAGQGGTTIDLSDNYRSRREVVNAVNFFFEQIFAVEFGGVRYDDRSKMKCGAWYPPLNGGESLAGPVELHLLQRGASEPNPNEPGDVSQSAGADLSDDVDNAPLPSSSETEDGTALEPGATGRYIEEEARVAGLRISQLMGMTPGTSRAQVWDADSQSYRPLQFRDIVLLMRSVRTSINDVVETFRQFGIPAYGAASTGFYGALEVKWLQSALSAIDNPRRELDFATLMRSPLAGFDDVELAQLRLAGRGNFYDAVRSAIREHSTDMPAALLDKLARFMRQFRAWRRLSRRASVEDVVRRVLEDTDFYYYIAGMPAGDARQANVEALLDKVREYDKQSMDGLFGFVEKSRRSVEHNLDAGEARTMGESEDVVRIMTIHQSKGLEFPVVVVLGLGTEFNLGKQERAVQLHRELGLGPYFAEPQTHRRWWTLPNIAIREAELTETLSEEARVLYVAMTRARERLILVGSSRQLQKDLSAAAPRWDFADRTLPLATLLRAKSYLDWIVPAALRHKDAAAVWETCLSEDAALHKDAVFRRKDPMLLHEAEFEVSLWNLPGFRSLYQEDQGLAHVPGAAAGDVEASRKRLDFSDPHRLRRDAAFEVSGDLLARPSAESETAQWGELYTRPLVPAKMSATDLRRLHVAKHKSRQPDENRFRSRQAAESLLEDPPFIRSRQVSGRESGTAFHHVMQHVDLNLPCESFAVVNELDRLLRAGRITQEERNMVNPDDILRFLASGLGRQLAACSRVWREQPFFSRIPVYPEYSVNAVEGQFVIVQGVIDVLAEEQNGWLIIDYKTDRIAPEQAAEKAMEYAAQVAAYRDVVAAWVPSGADVHTFLYFVHPGISIEMGPMSVEDIFQEG